MSRRLRIRNVDHDIPNVEHIRTCAGEFPVGPPEQGPDAGEQFTHPERFGHIVVGAHLQAEDFVHLITFPFLSPGPLVAFAFQTTAQTGGNARVIFDDQDMVMGFFGHIWILPDNKKSDSNF